MDGREPESGSFGDGDRLGSSISFRGDGERNDSSSGNCSSCELPVSGSHNLRMVSLEFVIDCFDLLFFLGVVLVGWRISALKVANRMRMRLSNSIYKNRIYYSGSFPMCKSSTYLV